MAVALTKEMEDLFRKVKSLLGSPVRSVELAFYPEMATLHCL